MRPRSLALLLTILSLVMIAVVVWRINKGWPAGPKTFTFICATIIVFIAAIITWRRAGRPDPGTPPPR